MNLISYTAMAISRWQPLSYQPVAGAVDSSSQECRIPNHQTYGIYACGKTAVLLPAGQKNNSLYVLMFCIPSISLFALRRRCLHPSGLSVHYDQAAHFVIGFSSRRWRISIRRDADGVFPQEKVKRPAFITAPAVSTFTIPGESQRGFLNERTYCRFDTGIAQRGVSLALFIGCRGRAESTTSR